MSDKENAFYKRVDVYKSIIKANCTQSSEDNKPLEMDWLKILYKEYHTRFLHDNNRIWSSGQIMIPLSLAPFVPLANMQSPSFVKLLILAAVSLTVIWTWLLIAETHKAFQQKCLAWTTAIEEVLNIDTRALDPRVITDPLQDLFVREKDIIPWVRRGLAVSLSIIWSIVLIFWE